MTVTASDACATDRALRGLVDLSRYAEARYAAKTWGAAERRVGMDIYYVVISLGAGSAERIYNTLYCSRDQAEHLIKLHKTQLKSDRTSCRSANANQMRLILHTAAYWLMWAVRRAMPTSAALRTAEFATIRLRLLKLAARVIETASRIRVAFASACPDAALFHSVALNLRSGSQDRAAQCRRPGRAQGGDRGLSGAARLVHARFAGLRRSPGRARVEPDADAVRGALGDAIKKGGDGLRHRPLLCWFSPRTWRGQ